MVNAEKWLAGVLNCSMQDLSVLERCRYPIEDILYWSGVQITFASIATSIFRHGQFYMDCSLRERVDAKEVGYEQLQQMNPRVDLEFYVDEINKPHCHIVQEKDSLYRTYAGEECAKFEHDTGFILERWN